jgi:enterochelin esterase-like enzyme
VTDLALASLALSIAWWRRAVWHWVILAVAALGAADVVSRVTIPQYVAGSGYPRSFLVWAAMPMFALAAAVWQWPRVAWWRRVFAFVSLPLLVAFAGLQVNAHYGYLPTIGDLLGAPLPGQVGANTIERAPLRFARAEGHRGSARPVVASRILDSHGSAVPAAAYQTGLVAEVDIPAPDSHFHARPAFVWVPPWYFTHPAVQLPVLMLFAGAPGRTSDWFRGGGALQTAWEYARAHDGYAPIMVVPDTNGRVFGDTECINSRMGQVKTYLTVDVPAFMHTHFNASLDARRWAVAGLSEGGTCALELSAQNPDRFRTFADFSGDALPNMGSVRNSLRVLYDYSYAAYIAHDPTRWFRRDASAGLAGYIAVGSKDFGCIPVEQKLTQTARRDGLNVILDVISGGGHNFATWRQSLADAFPWIAHRLDTPSVRS